MQASIISRIEFVEQGQGDIPIICLHGIGGSYDSFLPQFEALSPFARVVGWNMPGYGNSPLLDDMNFAALAQSLLGLMDGLDITKAHIIGHSIGGMIAQELALAFPERIETLVLIGTTSAFGGRDDQFKRQFLQARLAPLDDGLTMQMLAHQFVPEIVGRDASQNTIAAAIQTMEQVPTETYRAVLSCLVTFNRYYDSSDIALPVCLIAGDQDSNAPAVTMQKMASKIPNAEYHVISGAGHLINLEKATECNAILKRFYRL